VVDWRWVHIEEEKSVCSEEWKFEIRDYFVKSWYTNSRIQRTVKDSRIDY